MAIDVRGMAPLLQVFDMPKSIAFYRDVFGFTPIPTSATTRSNSNRRKLRRTG